MKTLISKFLAVALLLSVGSQVVAIDTPEWFKSGLETAKTTVNSVYKNVLKPYKERTPTPNQADQDLLVKAMSDSENLSWSESARLQFLKNAKAPWTEFTSENPTIANAIYYPVLALGTAAAVYGTYKGVKAIANWWKSEKAENNTVENYQKIAAAAYEMQNSQEGSLVETYKSLKMNDTTLEYLAEQFDFVRKNECEPVVNILYRDALETYLEGIIFPVVAQVSAAK